MNIKNILDDDLVSLGAMSIIWWSFREERICDLGLMMLFQPGLGWSVLGLLGRPVDSGRLAPL